MRTELLDLEAIAVALAYAGLGMVAAGALALGILSSRLSRQFWNW